MPYRTVFCDRTEQLQEVWVDFVPANVLGITQNKSYVVKNVNCPQNNGECISKCKAWSITR